MELPRYDPALIETRWRERWRGLDTSVQPAPASGRSVFLLPILPSPAGQLHIRQVRVYTFADTWARYRRSRGDAVLFSIGFDAFTLFVENASARALIDPRKLAARTQAQIRTQFDRLALSFDWSRSFQTSDAEIYRWSQWLFLKLLERGLVYRADAPIDWCDECEAVLAVSLIQEGRCWRCDEPVRKVNRPQWFLRMGPYLDGLHQGTEGLAGWDVERTRQQSLFGRSEGVELEVQTSDGKTLTVFTSRPAAIGGAGFVAIAPDHPEAAAWCPASMREPQEAADATAERRADQVPAIDTGIRATIPGFPSSLPIVVSAIVSQRFGGGAMLGIPGRDGTDAAIARKLGIDILPPARVPPELPLRPAVRYRIRDFPLSRQRFWGAPIPIVRCPACGIVPVPEAELPVELPQDLVPGDKGNPLASRPDFLDRACPRCGGAARREIDTLDGHTDCLWCWLVPCIPAADRSRPFFDHPQLAQWLPAELVVWTEGRSESLLDIRFMTRVLRDLGFLGHLPEGEPFRNVLVTGTMSIDQEKSQEGVGDVSEASGLIRRYGADSVRLALLHAVSPRKDFKWTGASLVECSRFLRDIWNFVIERLPDLVPSKTNLTSSPDRDCNRLQTWRETAVAKVSESLDNLEFHSAARNVMRFFERIQQFDAAARKSRPTLSAAQRKALGESVATLLRVLAPMTPHLAEELWERCGGRALLADHPWPSPKQAFAFPPAPDAPAQTAPPAVGQVL